MMSDDVAPPLESISRQAFRSAGHDVISLRALRRQCEQLLEAPEDLHAFQQSLWDTTRADRCPMRLLADSICSNCPESWRALIMPLVGTIPVGAESTVEFAGFATAVRALLDRVVDTIARFEEIGEDTEVKAATGGLKGPVSERAVSTLFHHKFHTLHMAWRSCLTRSHRSGKLGVVDRKGLCAGICAAANIPHDTPAIIDFCRSVFPDGTNDAMDYKAFCRRFTYATACQGVHRQEGKAVKHFSLTNNALVLNPAAIGPGTVFACGKRNPEGRYTGEALLANLQDAATHFPREILVTALRRGLMVDIEMRLASARSRRFLTDTNNPIPHECTNDNAEVLEDLLIEYTRYLSYAWDTENKPTNLASSSVITDILAVINRNGNREGVVNLIERACQKDMVADLAVAHPSAQETSSSLYTTSQLSSIWRAIDAHQRKSWTFVSYEDIPLTCVNKQVLWRRCLELKHHAPHRDAGRKPFMKNKSVFGMPSKSGHMSHRGRELTLSKPRAHCRGSSQLFKSSVLLPQDVLEQVAEDRPTVCYAPLETEKVTGSLVCAICKGENHDDTWPHVVQDANLTKCLLCKGYGHQSIACPLRSKSRCTWCLGRLNLVVWYMRKPMDIEVVDGRVVGVKRHGYSHEIGVLVGYQVVLPPKYPAWVDFDTCHLNACHPEVNHVIMRDFECSIPISAICWKLKNAESLFLGGEHVLPWDSDIWKLEIEVKKLARKFQHQLTFLREETEFVALSRIDRRARRLRCEYVDLRYFEADVKIDVASNIVTDLRKNGLAAQRGVKKGMHAVLECSRNSKGEPIGEIVVKFKPIDGKAEEVNTERCASTDVHPDFKSFIATQIRTFGAKEMATQGAFSVPGLPNATKKYVLQYRDIRSLLEGYSKAKIMLPIVDKVNRFDKPTATGYRDLVLVTTHNLSIHFVPSIILSCWKHSQKEIEDLAAFATILLNKERGDHFFQQLLMAPMEERLGMCPVCEGVGHWQGNCPSVPRVDFRPLLKIHEELEVATLWS